MTTIMSSSETLLSPATVATSENGLSLRTHHISRSGFRRDGSPPTQAKLDAAKTHRVPYEDDNPVAGKKPKTRNVVKRAIHKIGKRARRAPPAPSTAAAPAVNTDPPKIEELGIDPRLLQKWVARKELQKQVGVAGEQKKLASRGAATLVLVGLSSGSVVWLKDRLLRRRDANGVVVLLAACIVAAAVGIACMIIVRRCA